jgi:hypothetical protein
MAALLLASAAAGYLLAPRRADDGDAPDPRYSEANAAEYVCVACMGGGDGPVLERLDALWGARGIGYSTDGSVWWGVSVRRDRSAEATRLLWTEPAFDPEHLPNLFMRKEAPASR